MPSPPADAERSSVGLALEVMRQKLPERVPGFAGGESSTLASNLLVATSGSMVNVASVAASRSPVESAGAQSCEAQEVARQTLPERSLVFVGERPSLPVSAQNLPVSVPDLIDEKPNPPVYMIPNQIGSPVNFHCYQRLLVSGSVCPTTSVCSPGWIETQAKDTDLQMVPVGEDEARLAVQPLNVLLLGRPIGEEGAITGGQAGSDTEMAGSEEGTTDADVGGTGTVGEVTNKAEETGGYLEIAVEDSIFAGDEDSRLAIVPFSQTVVEQPDSDIPGEVMDGMKRGIGAYAIYKGGSSSDSLVNVEGEQFIDVPLEVKTFGSSSRLSGRKGL
jgi:hypothetical protein